MKTEEILEGNRILAEFMGHNSDLGAAIRFMYSSSEPFPLSGNDANFDSVENEVQMEVEEFGSTLVINTLSFHNSWDWLMPVVEKIESIEDKNGYNIFWVKIDGVCCEIQQADSLDIIVEVDCESKIEAVFMACVEFIKWYNQKK